MMSIVLSCPESAIYASGHSSPLSVAEASSAASSAAADIGSDSLPQGTEMLETLVVTATRTPKLLKDTPVVTRLLTKADISRSGKTDIAQLLEQRLPGVEFSLGMAQNPQINFSGFGGGGILFLLDGERMAGETLDNPDYSRLNLQNVERVEIVKGAASSLYGSNATGGVINIISGRPAEGVHATIDARFGSHTMQHYGALATYRKNSLSNSLDASFDSQAEVKFPNRGDFTTMYATRSWNIRDRLTYTFSDEAYVTARASYFRRQRNSATDNHERYSDVAAGLRARWRDFSASYAFDRYDKYDYIPSEGTQTRDYSNRQNTLHAQYSHDFDGAGTITAGGDWIDDYLMSYEFGGDAHRQTNLDAYLQWDWHPVERIWIVPGLRYDWFSASRARRLSPKLSLLWRPANCSLRVNYAAGFRAPSLKELFMDFNMAGIFQVYGNPDLKSETSQNFSISGEWTRGGADVTITAFHNIVDNRIAYLWSDELMGQQYINLHRMHICGVDLSAVKSFDFGLTLQGEYIYTYEHYHKGDLRANPTRPHALTMQCDYTRFWKPEWRFVASLSFKWMSGVTGDVLAFFSQEASRRQYYPAYSMLNLMLSQDIGKHLTVSAGIDNLLNYVPKYYYYNSPLTTGIGFRVGLTARI